MKNLIAWFKANPLTIATIITILATAAQVFLGAFLEVFAYDGLQAGITAGLVAITATLAGFLGFEKPSTAERRKAIENGEAEVVLKTETK